MATNYALSSNGATATASSTYSGRSAAKAIDGIRHNQNDNNVHEWDSNGNPTVGTPEWLEVDFGQSRTITEIDVITVPDSGDFNTNPTLSDTITNGTGWGIRDFKIQYWNGAAWVDIANVSANDKVWRQFTFSAITCTKVRCLVTAQSNSSFNYARIVEFEAWGNPPTPSGVTSYGSRSGYGYPSAYRFA